MIPVDDKALRDRRIAVRLAGKLEAVLGASPDTWPDFARRYALGAMLDVWQLCHDRESHVLDAADIDGAARVEGFAALLIGSELACDHPEGVYIAGARDRVEPLPSQASDSASEPESSNARARTRAYARTGVRTQARVHTGVRSSSSSVSDHVVTDHVPEVPDVHDVHTEEGDATRARRVTRTEFRPVTDAFQTRFVVEYNRKPQWGGREIKHVKDLVRAHGTEEVVRRVHVMFDDPPNWLRPPFTLGTLVANFDTFVIGASSARAPKRDLRVGRYEPDVTPADDDGRAPWEL